MLTAKMQNVHFKQTIRTLNSNNFDLAESSMKHIKLVMNQKLYPSHASREYNATSYTGGF